MEINIFEHEPHKDEYYFDSEGKRITLEKLVRLEPDWAANVIRHLKIRLKEHRVGPTMEEQEDAKTGLYNQQNSFNARSLMVGPKAYKVFMK